MQHFLLSSLYSFDSIFSDIVWIDKLHICVKGSCFNVYNETEKLYFLTFPGSGCKKGKNDSSIKRKKELQPQKTYILRKRAQKLRNIPT